MKKIVTIFLCLLFLPVAIALADNASLEDTTWELGMIAVIETEEYLDGDFIEENNLMVTFRFEANGAVTLETPSNVFNGIYQLTDNELDLNFGDDGHIWTTINEGEYGLLMFSFVNIFEEGCIHLFVLREGTFGGSVPADPDPDPVTVDPTPAPVQPTPEPQAPEAPATSQDAIELVGTFWEIIRAESPDGILDRNDLVRIDYLLEFEFRRNGVAICKFKNSSDWMEERGTYQLSGNTLSISIPSLPAMSTVIQNGVFIIPNFNNTGEDYTFRQTSSPASASASGGMPRILRDALWGGVIGAVAGGVVWLFRRKKKKTDAAQATPPEFNPAAPAYYPTPSSTPAPMATSAPMASMPVGNAPVGTIQRQIYCTSGPMMGSTYPVTGPIRFGRDPHQCQIVFPAEAAGISALHCEVQPQPSGVLLYDHGSTYGTFLLNGRKLNANESVILNPGDGFYLAENRNSFKVL